MDAHTRSRLTRARHSAVAELVRQRHSFMRRWWLPTAGLATAALVAVIVVLNVETDDTERQLAATLVAEDIDLLSNADDIELLEDMEFYAWLDSEPDVGEATQHAPGAAPSRS
jgi:acyl-CoA synthetase (AMP-forming)/AMP-acid ligase II